MNTPLEQHLAWFSGLTLSTLARIETVYAANARFADPVHALTGRDAIQVLYARMFDTLETPRFTINRVIAEGDSAFVAWRFDYRYRGRAFGFDGASVLDMDDAGLIAHQQDYWDSADALAPLPLVGSLLRLIKRRMA
ncbi:nuclear transport factor 2 family protein [Crenobacter caeni]|uniref:Nuclear transport factor 2 family protein n=1 Tax=Crenobacter caeni TaxID=2705474 RepID=A0A6B2KQ05_9NEIS|nr:nuclear transport factor 2 family protein [Crenobacter caeni]NDV12230.1 nuclear transport factor 2 family protein [Crenobacter caeni]